MPNISKIMLDSVLYDITDLVARDELQGKLDSPTTSGIAGQVLSKTESGTLWIDNSNPTNDPYIYLKTPVEAAVGLDDILTLVVEVSSDNLFTNITSFTHEGSELFNPATGHWINTPSRGLDIAMTDTVIRLPRPTIEYENYRYKWFINNIAGVWHV